MMTMTFSRFIFFVAMETKLADKHDKKLKKKEIGIKLQKRGNKLKNDSVIRSL